MVHHVVQAPRLAHMVQRIRIACTGTAGRVIRELEAIAASDVYHREALLNHNERTAHRGRESFVAIVMTSHSEQQSARCVCERARASRVGADSRADMIMIGSEIGMRGSPIIGSRSCHHTSYQPLRLPLREQASTSPPSSLLKLGGLL